MFNRTVRLRINRFVCYLILSNVSKRFEKKFKFDAHVNLLSQCCRHFGTHPTESLSSRRMNAPGVAPCTVKSRSAISNNRHSSTEYPRNTDIRRSRYTVHCVMCTHRPTRAYTITDLIIQRTFYAICTLLTSAHYVLSCSIGLIINGAYIVYAICTLLTSAHYVLSCSIELIINGAYVVCAMCTLLTSAHYYPFMQCWTCNI